MELLNKIQQQLKVPKSQYNSFSKYNYRNAEDILEAVKPLLGDGHLVLFDEIVLIGDRYYVKATAELHNGQDIRRSFAYAREATEKKGMDEAQITGAASSYARKYALNGLFLIDDTKDADHDSAAKKPEKQTWPAKRVVPDEYDQSPVPDNTPVISTGDNTGEEPPKAPAKQAKPPTLGQKKALVKQLLDKQSLVELKTPEEYAEACYTMTGLKLTEANYDLIIRKITDLHYGKLDEK